MQITYNSDLPHEYQAIEESDEGEADEQEEYIESTEAGNETTELVVSQPREINVQISREIDKFCSFSISATPRIAPQETYRFDCITCMAKFRW